MEEKLRDLVFRSLQRKLRETGKVQDCSLQDIAIIKPSCEMQADATFLSSAN